jgi:hypothetical protein
MRWTEKAPEFLESVVSAFQAEDVNSVELLITLFGVQTQYTHGVKNGRPGEWS